MEDVCFGNFLDYAGDFETDSENDEDCNGSLGMDIGGEYLDADSENEEGDRGNLESCEYCHVDSLLARASSNRPVEKIEIQIIFL